MISDPLSLPSSHRFTASNLTYIIVTVNSIIFFILLVRFYSNRGVSNLKFIGFFEL